MLNITDQQIILYLVYYLMVGDDFVVGVLYGGGDEHVQGGGD